MTDVAHLEAAVEALSERQARALGRLLFEQAHRLADEELGEMGAVVHQLGAVLLDRADALHRLFAALDPDVDTTEGAQVQEGQTLADLVADADLAEGDPDVC